MITREIIQDMFDDVRTRSLFDIDAICCWGYFFTDHDRQRLVDAAPALEQHGYRFVSILEPAPENDDQGLFFLHVEKLEHHTVDTLLARNVRLYTLARELGLETYDGMDVGPAK